MDAAVHAALEEICCESSAGLHLRNLWQKLSTSLASSDLPVSCPGVKRAVWENLLEVPGLELVSPDGVVAREDLINCTVEECEEMDVRVVAPEVMRKSFLGIYEIEVSGSSSLSDTQRVILERLAVARTNGIAQSDLSKELCIASNNLFYQVKRLETQGLIVRQPTVIRKKQASEIREPNDGSIISTNMLYLRRFAKHLGSQQRLEITKEDKLLVDGEAAEYHAETGDDFGRDIAKEDIHIKDFLPALKAICDKLEKAPGKVLVITDIKRDLGYRGSSGHRSWRNICHRLKDAGVIEECCTMINKKEVNCLRLLKSFSPSNFEPKARGRGRDDIDTEHSINVMKRGQITEQLVELPILRQIYDIIDAAGSKGLTNLEVCGKLGLCSKEYHKRYFKQMISRFGLHLQLESHNRTEIYRVWTAGNFIPESSHMVRTKTETVSQGADKSNSLGDFDVQDKVTQPVQVVDTPTLVGNARDISESETDATVITETSTGTITNNEGSRILLLECNMQNSDAGRHTGVPHQELVQGSISITSDNMLQAGDAPAVTPPRRRSHVRLTMGANSSQREQRILKLLQDEKFLIRPELHRRIESFEKEKNTMMDRKTLQRCLNKLQQDGYCKCIHIRVPGVTNCGHSRTTEVVLHPSVYSMSPELLGQIHDRLRSFETQSRQQSYTRHKSGQSVPVLDNVHRIPQSVRSNDQSARSEVMRTNGFVLAKMVRTKLLHIFLWSWVCTSPDCDDVLLSSDHSYDLKNPHSSCKLFKLGMAIKCMPLELFLQVVGSAQNYEDMVHKCKSGLLLSDLPTEEYKSLMDTRATARLSWLIDILRRLKLIRLVSKGRAEDEASSRFTTLTHALELKPYIEEPVPIVASSGFLFPDLRPQVRHDFVLSSREAVDEYWNTLEYSYATTKSRAALLAFPGSAVHEVFHTKSWASVRVMTASQRAELLKCVAKDEPNKKLSLRECEKIAKDLNLTLEQVLRVYNDKRQQRLTRFQRVSDAEGRESQPLKSKKSSHKRKQSSDRVTSKRFRASVPRSIVGVVSPLLDSDNQFAKEREKDCLLQRDYAGDYVEGSDEPESNDEERESRNFIHNRALSRSSSARQKKFSWTEDADRQLVMAYARHRATLGAKFHRADWPSLSNLPAPPDACKRRMALMNSYIPCRKAVMRLCNMLAERYAKYLETFQDKMNHENPGEMVRSYGFEEDNMSSAPMSEKWANFDEDAIKVALHNVLIHRKMAKLKATKDIFTDRKNEDDDFETCTEGKASGERSSFLQGASLSRRMHESVAIANAAELFKLIFLSKSTTPEVATLLAETLRRYSEHDLFSAFSYLRDQKIMIGGSSQNPFALSQHFVHSISSSLYPSDTGKRAAKFTCWLQEREKELIEMGIDAPLDLQCGELLTLCALVSSGELSVSPSLPDEGVGEAEDNRASKRKCDSSELDDGDTFKKRKTSFAVEGEITSRREKGFPGIMLSLHCKTIFGSLSIGSGKNDEMYSETSSGRTDQRNNLSGLDDSSQPDVAAYLREILDSGKTVHHELDLNESPWEAMTRHAEHLLSSCSYEAKGSSVHPDLFKTLYSRIQKAGDNGLSMKDISKVLNVNDEKMLDILIEVLETFGRALKVNAYDSVHIVDSLYRSKYFLTSIHDRVATRLRAPKRKNEAGHMPLNLDNHVDKVAASENEIAMNVDEVHRVTILNLLEDGADTATEISTVDKITDYQHSEGAPSKVNGVFEIHSADTWTFRPLLPWMNGDGTTNELVYKRLIRRVLGIVMQNPGILEDGIINQMHGLNPQSCRKLLEIMILDNHIITRKMHQMTSTQPPSILSNLLGDRFRKSKSICRVHYFANPMSTNLL